MALGSLTEKDRFEFHGSARMTGTVGETTPDGIVVFLDHATQDGVRRRHPKVETWHASMRVRKL